MAAEELYIPYKSSSTIRICRLQLEPPLSTFFIKSEQLALSL